ncbi:hypothetical protein [Hwanghaeella grinnelliae]|uniref:hypothetical protein n=1 Tax=Hwanghaeella grinnelliae TaxID=2500179 RepID=UPI00129AD402|nr:hypothetical protein [Hwanghaeella grinnelliae]
MTILSVPVLAAYDPVAKAITETAAVGPPFADQCYDGKEMPICPIPVLWLLMRSAELV